MQAFEIDYEKHGRDIVLQDIQDKTQQQQEEIDQQDLKEDQQLYDPDRIISIRNVHKTYLLGVEGVTALRGVTFDVKEGEFIIILGTSGGGKTTLLNIMGTIDKPTKGDVYICGQKIKSNTEDKFLASLRLVRLGFVFQTFNLIGSLTALENVELPMILKGDLNKAQIRKRALDLLELVGLKERVNHFPNQLSGGEQQRVTITRALSNKPKILLLDEPTGDLDTKNSDLIMKLLLDLNIKQGITMIMVTHDVALKCYANKVIRIMDGKISNIEEIDPKIRDYNYNTLEKIVNGELKPEQAEQMLGVRSGAVQHLFDTKQQNQQQSEQLIQQKAPPQKTEKRRPKDYAVIRFSREKYTQ